MATPESDLGRSVVSDLEYLQRGWLKSIDDDTLRRDSGVLRRLLIDGTLQRHRKEVGLRGMPTVRAVDLKAVLCRRPYSAVKLGVAGGGMVDGVFIAGALLVQGSDVPVGDEPPTVDLKLGDFLTVPSLILDGTVITRRDVIKYVANKLGGVHFDSKRGPEDHAYVAMDAHGAGATLMGKNAIYFELLSIGQLLLASPDVAELLPAGTEPHPHPLPSPT